MKLPTPIDSSLRLYSPLNRTILTHAIVITLATLLIGGCSNKHKPATQVAAKVNSDEISIHQVNNVLAQLPQVAPENVDQARRDVLAKLVNQQLAVQEAINLKLDRSPEVMMMVEASKREILTRVYLQRLVAGLPKPSAEDAKKFYDEHPELFAQRRIYKLQEISIKSPHPPLADLQKMIAGKSMTDIVAQLKQQNILSTSNSGTRAAEQIALPMLAELAKLKDGETSVIEMPQVVSIVHIEASQLLPITEEVAMQHIPQYLMSEQAKVAINNDIEHLKSKSKIEYMNDFASGTHPANTAAATQTTQPAAQPTTQPVAETTKATNSIERGIAGIN